MKKYKFPLEQVLEVRKKIERERQGELAEAHQMVADGDQILGDMRTETYRSQGDYGQLQRQNQVTPQECMHYYDYFCSIESHMKIQQLHIGELEAEAEKKREALEEALRDRLVVEEMKKSELKKFQEKSKKSEQISVDDISTIAYNYRRKISGNQQG